MIREHYRSRILSKLLTPRLGVVFLFLTILMLTLATAAAQGPGIDSRQESGAEELVLRRTHFPDADVVDLLPSQDAYITSNRPGQNYGQDSSLWIGYDVSRTGGGAERPYLKWDLSVVPPSAVINSAEFWFAVSKSIPSSDAAMSVQARHVVASWAENSLTWNSAPAPNNQAVVSGGLITKLTGWQQIDVTSLVKDWRSGAEANNGLVV
ncbi:MAG: DNRLRE domain-containing protein, partial [Candidatus Promineifilaceae bacterium]